MNVQDAVEKALKKAYQLGQIYWQQADSDFESYHKKSDLTRLKFNALLHETLTLIKENPDVNDAARYRWLRDENDWNVEPRIDESDGSKWQLTFYTSKLFEEENDLDSAIDEELPEPSLEERIDVAIKEVGLYGSKEFKIVPLAKIDIHTTDS